MGRRPAWDRTGDGRQLVFGVAVTLVLDNIVGEVQAVAHSGAYALVMRHKALTNGVYDNQLVRIPLGGVGGGEQVLVDGGRLDYARLTTGDSRVLLLRAGTTFSAFGPFGGGPELAVRGSGAEPLSADAKD